MTARDPYRLRKVRAALKTAGDEGLNRDQLSRMLGICVKEISRAMHIYARTGMGVRRCSNRRDATWYWAPRDGDPEPVAPQQACERVWVQPAEPVVTIERGIKITRQALPEDPRFYVDPTTFRGGDLMREWHQLRNEPLTHGERGRRG